MLSGLKGRTAFQHRLLEKFEIAPRLMAVLVVIMLKAIDNVSIICPTRGLHGLTISQDDKVMHVTLAPTFFAYGVFLVLITVLGV